MLAGAYLLLVISFVVWHWFVVGFPVNRVRAWLRQDRLYEDAETDVELSEGNAVVEGDAVAEDEA